VRVEAATAHRSSSFSSIFQIEVAAQPCAFLLSGGLLIPGLIVYDPRSNNIKGERSSYK
jgi:hypothetical protein